MLVEQVIKQLYKLINVTKVTAINDDAVVVREYTIKAHATRPTARDQTLSTSFAQIIDVSPESMTVEITGTEDKVESLISMLRPFGIKEMARTGRVAMVRGAAPNGAPL